jgi:hypothetical protein
VGDKAMLEATGRYYYVTGAGSGGGTTANREGQEHIARVNVGWTVRLYGPHAIGLQYLISSRDTSSAGPNRHQSVQTVSLTYNFLSHAQFGAVEWRSDGAASR